MISTFKHTDSNWASGQILIRFPHFIEPAYTVKALTLSLTIIATQPCSIAQDGLSLIDGW